MLTGLPVRLGAAALVGVVILLLLNGSHETQTVSHVIREIHKIALAKPQGGLIGPWWVSAEKIDALTGELKAFKIECTSVHAAARTATLRVDPETDSFQFEMLDVVLASVSRPGDETTEHHLVHVDRYVLGPIPYGVDIVPDSGSRRLRPLPSQRAIRGGTESDPHSESLVR